jgi:hypothetical protein
MRSGFSGVYTCRKNQLTSGKHEVTDPANPQEHFCFIWSGPIEAWKEMATEISGHVAIQYRHRMATGI